MRHSAPSDRAPGDRPRFDHPAYLRRAWSELRCRSFHEALPRMRGAGGAEHATLALAWARLVAAAIAVSGPGDDFDAFLATHPELADADHVLRHYSPERIASARARHEFVLPDRSPLPAAGRGIGTETVKAS